MRARRFPELLSSVQELLDRLAEQVPRSPGGLLRAYIHAARVPLQQPRLDLGKHGERVSMTRTPLNALQGDYNSLMDSGATTFAQPNVPSQNCPAKGLKLLLQYLLT